MFYALFNGNDLVAFTEQIPFTGTPELWEIIQNGKKIVYDRVEDRWDWHDAPFDYVEGLAQKATEMLGTLHVATMSGSTSPRHDIVEVPKVGDEVSYAFNGDSYPCGKIVRLTPTLTVITDEGKRFRRRGKSGSWVMEGGTWGLVKGHVREQNPHI